MQQTLTSSRGCDDTQENLNFSTPAAPFSHSMHAVRRCCKLEERMHDPPAISLHSDAWKHTEADTQHDVMMQNDDTPTMMMTVSDASTAGPSRPNRRRIGA